MSIDDAPSVGEVRSLIESHIQSYIKTRQKAGSDAPVSDNECADLVDHIIELKTQSDSPQLAAARLDNIFRDKFVNIVQTTDITNPAFLELWMIIDLITVLSDNECCEKGLNFLLIEELLDSQTIDGCRKVFDYLESRRERMIVKYWPEKKLVILRCCNELLRRLSRAEDTVFCGRVFIYLFQDFPLGDKSSVNLRGEFHTDNITTFDPSPQKSDDAIKPMEIDTDHAQGPSGAHTPASTAPDSDTISKTGRSTPLPRPSKSEPKPAEQPPDLDVLYPKFWSLQTLFSSPTRLFDPSSMSQFKEGLNLTLLCFKSISTSSSAPASSTAGTKRKRSDINSNTSSASPFNPKYLTNRDLFDLEIHDLAFRRHMLVQALIMLDFLLSLSPTAKLKNDDLIHWTPPPKPDKDETEEEKDRKIQPNKSVLYPYTLSDDDVKWCTSTRQQISLYLQSQGPGNEGKMYSRMVETVLSRDKNWVRWKAESCPKISRAPVSAATYIEAQQTLVDLTSKKPMPAPMGAGDFAFLNHSSSMESLKHPSRRYKRPSMQEYYKMIQMDDLDADFAGEEEKKEIEERKAGRVWRALRASVEEGKRTVLCEKLRGTGSGSGKGGGEEWNLKALIGEDEDEEGKEEEVKKEDAGDENVVKTMSNAATPAVGTPAAVEEALATPSANDGAADEQIEEAIGSPKPEHVAPLPTGTEEEGTPSPNPAESGVMQDSSAVPVAEKTSVADAIAAAVEAEEVDADVDADAVGAAMQPGESGQQDEDEIMDDFAPGGLDDAEEGD